MTKQNVDIKKMLTDAIDQVGGIFTKDTKKGFTILQVMFILTLVGSFLSGIIGTFLVITGVLMGIIGASKLKIEMFGEKKVPEVETPASEEKTE